MCVAKGVLGVHRHTQGTPAHPMARIPRTFARIAGFTAWCYTHFALNALEYAISRLWNTQQNSVTGFTISPNPITFSIPNLKNETTLMSAPPTPPPQRKSWLRQWLLLTLVLW